MMLTSEAVRNGAQRCQECEVNAYLVKPVGAFDLMQAIAACLGDKAVSRDMPPAPPGKQFPVGSVRPLHFLLAEDNPVNQRLAVRILERCGHTVVTAGDGKQALDLFEQGRPDEYDVVLLDVQMPEMDGFEVVSRIREHEAKLGGRRKPVIALTAHAMQGDRERCLAAGMDAYLSKPIMADELFATVESLLKSVPGDCAMVPCA